MKMNFARRGRGKVAQLPHAVRNVVNQSLRDGAPYAQIMGELEGMGFGGITKWNLIQWRKRGYMRWLEGQEEFERSHAMSAEAEALLGQLQPGGKLERADLGEAVLGSQLEGLLESFKAEERGSEEYLRLVRAFTGFMLARAQRQRVELERTRQEMELRKTKPKGKRKGMTAEEVADFKEKIRLI